MSRSIIVEGRNCWCSARVDRLAFLIDGAAYFGAVAEAIERAREQVLILGWDFDARVRLRYGNDSRDRVGDVLKRAVRRSRGLTVRILEWDFSLMHAFRRRPIPFISRPAPYHRRIYIRTDNAHPVGASHHQKLVVVDDSVAFLGGLDLAARRWDTADHAVNDPRRVDPGGERYPPFHDVQVAVDGAAAARLGELARERWRRATGERLAAPRRGGEVWPPSLPAELEAATVAIARTEPAFAGRGEVREVERLFVDCIRAAKRWIYIENQYLTSASVADVLAERLAERDGPEIAIVLTRDSSGWLEQSTMDVLRTRVLRRLRSIDRRGRLRVYYPVVAGDSGETDVYVHAKAMVVDDRLARVGSANLSNRSMGFDTECDLALESDGDSRIEQVIGGLRDRLLGEHLGVEPQRVRATLAASGSLLKTVESLRGSGRRLEPLDREAPAWLMAALPDREVMDPERPISLQQWLEDYVPTEPRRFSRFNIIGVALLGLLALGLTAVHGLTPLGTALQPLTAADTLPLEPVLAGPVALAAIYVVGGLILIPVTILTVATVLVYGPFLGFGYALFGVGLSAIAGYWLGRSLERDAVLRIARSFVNPVGANLACTGLRPITMLRLLPAIPFSLVSLVAGASRARLGDFALGTLLGITPWLAGVTLLADRLAAAIRDPGALSLASLVAVVAGLSLGTWALLRRLGGRRTSQA